jgi:hypothetical protein
VAHSLLLLVCFGEPVWGDHLLRCSFAPEAGFLAAIGLGSLALAHLLRSRKDRHVGIRTAERRVPFDVTSADGSKKEVKDCRRE